MSFLTLLSRTDVVPDEYGSGGIQGLWEEKHESVCSFSAVPVNPGLRLCGGCEELPA